MRPFRTLLVELAVVAAAVGTTSCREVRPQGGLPASVHAGFKPRIVSNDRGFWFIVTDEPISKPFLAIGEGAAREVYYAIAEAPRLARVMPVTPFAYATLDASRNTRVDATWLDAPADAGPDLPDTVGWLPSPNEPARWAGPKPADGTALVLVAGQLPREFDLADWWVGTAVVRGGQVADVKYWRDVTGPVMALPDGVVPARPLRIATAGVSVAPAPGIEVATSVELPEAAPSSYVMRPAGLRAGVDAVVARRAEDVAAVVLTRPVIRDGTPLTLTLEPAAVVAAEVPRTLRALRDLAAGRALVAAREILDVAVPAQENQVALRYRALEALAAAGYVDWTRHALMNEVPGLDADVALYLAQSHFLAGDLDRAADFEQRAHARFSEWTTPAAEHGTARGLLLRARLAAKRADLDTAIASALDAAKWFDAAGDPMRAADAELLAAAYAQAAGDPSQAIKAAALARSRYYHGHSVYHAAMAELVLAEIYAAAGERAEARKMTELAAERFRALGDDVGSNRARIAAARAREDSERAAAVKEIEAALERAQRQGDFVGVVDAAATLVLLGAASPAMTGPYGLVVAAGLVRTEDPYVRSRGARALTVLCDRGMADAVTAVAGASPRDIAVARAACNAPATDDGGAMLATLVAEGWRALVSGADAQTQAAAARVATALTTQAVEAMRTDAADGFLFLAAAARSTGNETGDTQVRAAVDTLARYVDPTRLAASLEAAADRAAARGQAWLVDALLHAAMRAASDNRQPELARALALKRVRMGRDAEIWPATLAAARDAEAIVGTAGPESAASLAWLALVSAEALTRLGREPDAAVARARAEQTAEGLDAIASLDFHVFSAEVAANLGDTARAAAALERAEALEAATQLPDEARRLTRARLAIVQGASARDAAAAATAFAVAAEGLVGLASTPAVLRARVAALAGVARHTPERRRLDAALADLESVRGDAMRSHPELAPLAISALVRAETEAGDPSRGIELVNAATAAGFSPATSHLAARCLVARAAGLAQHEGAVGLLTACAASSDEPVRSEARLLAALIDPSAAVADKNRAAREALAARAAGAQAPDLERLRFISELAAGTAAANPAREQRLVASLERAAAGAAARPIVDAVVAVVDYYLAVGQPDRARTVVDENSGAFYDVGPQGAGQLAHLRAAIALSALEPLALSFAVRAIAETPDLAPADAAALALVAAQSATVFGMWPSARHHLATARELAPRTGPLRQSIEAFGRRFAL